MKLIRETLYLGLTNSSLTDSDFNWQKQLLSEIK